MKTPIKPFVIEVKRSRLSSSAAGPVRAEPQMAVELREPASAVPVSAARQLAEQTFKDLVSGAPDKNQRIFTVEDVFRPAVTVDEAETLPPVTAITPDPEGSSARPVETVVPKPRKPRGRKPSAKNAGNIAEAEIKAPQGSSVKAAFQVEFSEIRAKRPPARAKERLPHTSPGETVAATTVEENIRLPEQQGVDIGWRPGERWKRRLRHLR